ncbi:uncharacterized protein BDV17DRAFT_256016 [Aspergillus undulatus]|uniref:uncharacterized protein n=1 Tax=Aspergillus undulatus TaxID=1810928 RepID=UPI003CCDDA02
MDHHQMRVAHQNRANAESKEVVAKGYAHGSGTTTYRKMDGVWSLQALNHICDGPSSEERTVCTIRKKTVSVPVRERMKSPTAASEVIAVTGSA